jgi:DHA1 family bicyclomycin/chloramphenicol resistance-like MFS transporter
LQGFMSTLGGALVGALIGRQFNGTAVPLVAGSLGCGLAGLLFVLLAEKGRLFRGHHTVGDMPAGQVEGAGWH